MFAYDQREIHDTDIVVAYSLLFLSFPLGYVVAAIVGVVFQVLYDITGIVVPGGFMSNLATWLVIGATGYIQWFVFVPWCMRKWRASSNPTVDPDARNSGARGSS